MTAGASYRYRAARADGLVELGVLHAESRDAVSAALATRGLFAVAIEADEPGDTPRRTMPGRDVAQGLRLLANLLAAGLPMHRALAALDEVAPRSWHALLSHVRAAVRDGASLGGALGSAPVALPSVALGIIEAGEAGVGLAPSVARAAAVTESAEATRAALRGALAYPAVLALAGTASIAFLVTVVLPRFALILADLGQALPTSTRLLIGAGAVARSATIPALLAVVALVAAWRLWLRNPASAERWAMAMLDVPVVGGVRHALATARAGEALSALLAGGVSLTAALPPAARASSDAAVRAALLRTRERLLRGEPLSHALAEERAMTPLAVRLVRTGEETGRLADLLGEAARTERERAEELVRAAVRLVEPAFILLFGALVAFAAAALLQALYGIRPV